MKQKLTGGISKMTSKRMTENKEKEKQYKANPELAKLAYLLRSGGRINMYVPPAHITFEILLNEIGENNIKYPIEEQEEARIKLWKIWCKTMKGYSSYGKISPKPISQSKINKSSKTKTGGGQKTDSELLTELNATRAGILNILSKSRKREKEYKAELAYFKSAEKDANKYVKVALQIKYDVDDLTPDEIRALAENSVIRYPFQDDGYTQLYKPVHNLYMYGMQLPHQYNRKQLLETMLYLISKKSIYNYVDLHDCYKTSKDVYDVVQGIGCNPYDRQVQLEMWGKAVSAIYPEESNTLYYGIEGYEDMMAGSAGAWESIARIKDVKDPSNSVVIHCLAGAGRTGSVLLYLLLRDHFDRSTTIHRLQRPYYGYTTISEFIDVNRIMFVEVGTATDVELMKKEVFDVSKLTSATRLRQRLNRIFFHLAKEFKVNTFYTFGIPTKVVVDLPDDEFSNHIERTVDWDEIDTNKGIVIELFK
jgi:hypothetical protein